MWKEKNFRAKQVDNILSPNDVKKIDESHRITESEEYKFWTKHKIFNQLN